MLKSLAPRVFVVSLFFSLAALVLWVGSRPIVRAPSKGAGGTTLPVVIATTDSLRPAFLALEMWNRERGCLSYLLTVGGSVGGSLGGQVAYVGALCAQRGSVGLLLGGDHRQLPLAASDLIGGTGLSSPASRIQLVPVVTTPQGPIPEGVQVRRAPVRDLAEAWAFVEACRENGRTLDELIVTDGLLSAAGISGSSLSWPPPSAAVFDDRP